jgi:hypothetical protein
MRLLMRRAVPVARYRVHLFPVVRHVVEVEAATAEEAARRADSLVEWYQEYPEPHARELGFQGFAEETLDEVLVDPLICPACGSTELSPSDSDHVENTCRGCGQHYKSLPQVIDYNSSCWFSLGQDKCIMSGG